MSLYPSALSQMQRKNDETEVVIDLVTNYPWDDVLTFNIKTSVAFPFYLRIPQWASTATVQVGTSPATNTPSGEYYRLAVRFPRLACRFSFQIRLLISITYLYCRFQQEAQ